MYSLFTAKLKLPDGGERGAYSAKKKTLKQKTRGFKIAHLESRCRVVRSLVATVNSGLCLVLLLPKFRVESLLVEQELLVCAGLYDEALIHYDDAVGVTDGAEAVRNDNGRLCFHLLQRIDRLLNDLKYLGTSIHYQSGDSLLGNIGQVIYLLASGVQCRGGLVKQQDGRLLDQGSCNCDALLLPTAHHDAALAYIRIVPLRKFHNEVMSVARNTSVQHIRVHTATDAGTLSCKNARTVFNQYILNKNRYIIISYPIQHLSME